ncbi:hypothetical protein NC652_028165 [Populus alba x Populus x berolinensis]|uniref:Secreted protein n=2 Tax=Populus alba x Populus x berolinensis TaxID=444605 RepID=A0AAD6M6L2_9ROSI|nr:hypothetical protein NC652_028165 [Populus alba x Populus x berolinensis]KAJ6979946.1 hypothetical protein NC653_027930 [Populus alba x Populus x berolinensis]
MMKNWCASFCIPNSLTLALPPLLLLEIATSMPVNLSKSGTPSAESMVRMFSSSLTSKGKAPIPMSPAKSPVALQHGIERTKTIKYVSKLTKIIVSRPSRKASVTEILNLTNLAAVG